MPATDEYRRAHLTWAVQHILARPGGTVQIAGPYQAVILGPGMNHVIHIILTILFMGFWLPIWLLVALTHKRSVYQITVDEDGQLTIYDATKRVPMAMAPDGTLMYAR